MLMAFLKRLGDILLNALEKMVNQDIDGDGDIGVVGQVKKGGKDGNV